MTDKEAIKLAYDYIVYGTGDLQQVLIALLDAMDEDLAQPEQEPDVVMHWDSHTWTTNNPPPKGSGDVNLYYAPAAPLQEPVIDKSAAIRIATALGWEPKRTEQNFCSRCGKRTPDAITIHTCTPPQENT